ncbi:MAG: MJ0042-type zinc finger domain-containing protein, partial [Steroidobacteraceae bacterium]
MFTVCPKCSLKLVVTAADLRVAQGYVRCGRCSNVFNALVGLSDEQQAVLAQEERAAADADQAVATAGSEQPAARAGVPQAAAPQPAPVTPGDGVEEPISDTRFEFDPVATDVSEVFVEPESDDTGSTGRSETITLRTEDPRPEDASPEDTSPGRAPAEGTSPENASRDSASQEPPASGDLDAHSLEAAQLELDAPYLEATDEFELADLEPLLDASAAPGPSTMGSTAQPQPARSDGRDVVDVVDVADVAEASDASGAPDAAPAAERSPAPRDLPSSPDGALD